MIPGTELRSGMSWSEVSTRINKLVTERDGEWCGLPLPLAGLGLVLESKHPGASRLKKLQEIVDGGPKASVGVDPELVGWSVVNEWHTMNHRLGSGTVYILRHVDGRTQLGFDPDQPKKNRMLLGPLSTIDAWNLETELVAIDKLATMISERMFGAYVLTGSFLWSSKRSGLTYMFRRCRPTVVLSPHGGRRDYFLEGAEPDDSMRVLCCLCLHPLAYYAGTFAGAMTPTDDVIAHLLLAKADEHLYWKRANHHRTTAPEAGV